MDLEQEFLPPVHAAADLHGDDGSVADDAADDKLVGYILCDQLTGAIQRYPVALAHGKGRQLTEFPEAVAERIQIVSACDGHQVGAVGEIGLIGAIECGAPTRRVDEQRARERPADIPFGDQVPDIVDRRRNPALKSDGMADSLALGCLQHCDGLGGVASERPFRIDVLAGVDRGHDRREMVGHLDADGDQVDVRMPCELCGVGERQWYAIVLRGGVRCLLPRGADRDDLEVRQRQ